MEDKIDFEKELKRLEEIASKMEDKAISLDDSILLYEEGMKITKKGFSQYANVISDELMDKLIALVDKKITDARDLILKADFSINPKNIIGDKEIIGCKYCKYNDICNRKNEDIVNLKKYKDFSFLEVGDKDA